VYTLQAVTDLGIALIAFGDLLAEGASKPVPHVECNPEDLCTIMYTSGTTGDPKGVQIKHSNVLAEIRAAMGLLQNSLGFILDSDDVFLSYLPLAHIFDRCVCVYGRPCILFPIN
jgi:long-chain acyl-CoA synthetase